MASYPELAGRTALLAGGATLIGARLARAFAAHGCKVVIADIDAQGGQSAAAACGENTLFVATDVTSDASIDACLETTRARFGSADILVNITTSYLDDGLATSRETWLRALNIGLVGAAMLAQKMRDDLAAGQGTIVNFSSASAHRAQAGRFVYPAIKSAIAQLTRSQALEFAPLGVRVNAIAPGWTWSNVISTLSNGDRARADKVGGPFHMLGRIADPDELTGAVLFLCSDAARFITGAELPVDGGYLAMGPEQAGNAIGGLLER
ncbi:SDR family oxidoreductase [Novosphingobium flavum]|uniref:SDR family oxidoreductase n=1 Tax=Novosphingobium aerophilum TaxID=2839843 RepID=UPI00163ADC3F|nr:SDR family oxidoreductase [Novosphingobium aerophilum]MBC2660180.1 SDR family oxidoreductase [Novosphingobium aerophilum]